MKCSTSTAWLIVRAMGSSSFSSCQRGYQSRPSRPGWPEAASSVWIACADKAHSRLTVTEGLCSCRGSCTLSAKLGRDHGGKVCGVGQGGGQRRCCAHELRGGREDGHGAEPPWLSASLMCGRRPRRRCSVVPGGRGVGCPAQNCHQAASRHIRTPEASGSARSATRARAAASGRGAPSRLRWRGRARPWASGIVKRAQCEKTPPGHSLGRIVAGWRHVAALAVPTRLPSMPFLLTMPPRG